METLARMPPKLARRSFPAKRALNERPDGRDKAARVDTGHLSLGDASERPTETSPARPAPRRREEAPRERRVPHAGALA